MSEEVMGSDIPIGPYILDEKTLEVMLPNYNEIFSMVDKFRETAGRIAQEAEGNKKKKYDKTFAILGGRGSGKSSALMSIRKYLCDRFTGKGDIFLDVVAPEDLGEQSEIMAWLLYCINREVECSKNSANVYSMYSENKLCRAEEGFDKKGKNIADVRNRAIRSYLRSSSSYKDVINRKNEDIDEFLYENEQILDAEQAFQSNFRELLDKLLEKKQKGGEERLLHVFFDDFDTDPKAASQVLDVIRKHLTHPQVVVYVAGDQETFSEALLIDTLKKDRLLSESMLSKTDFLFDTSADSQTLLETKKCQIRDYLKKVLPPAFRYKLTKLDTGEKKAHFYYSSKKNGESVNSKDKNGSGATMFISLLEGFWESFNKEKSVKNVFPWYPLDYSEQHGKQLISSYFTIFDSYPRGLMNILNFLYKNQSLGKIKDAYTVMNNLKHFIRTIVNSSTVLSKYENFIFEKYLQLPEKNEAKEYYVNYNLLLSDRIRQGGLNERLSLFVLGNFVENVMRLQKGGPAENDKNNPLSIDTHGESVLKDILFWSLKKNVEAIGDFNPEDVGFTIEQNKMLERNFDGMYDVRSILMFYGELLNYMPQNEFDRIYELTRNIYDDVDKGIICHKVDYFAVAYLNVFVKLLPQLLARLAKLNDAMWKKNINLFVMKNLLSVAYFINFSNSSINNVLTFGDKKTEGMYDFMLDEVPLVCNALQYVKAIKNGIRGILNLGKKEEMQFIGDIEEKYGGVIELVLTKIIESESALFDDVFLALLSHKNINAEIKKNLKNRLAFENYDDIDDADARMILFRFKKMYYSDEEFLKLVSVCENFSTAISMECEKIKSIKQQSKFNYLKNTEYIDKAVEKYKDVNKEIYEIWKECKDIGEDKMQKQEDKSV